MEKKVLIIGHAQHGKDLFAEYLGLSYKSSSVAALEIFLYSRLNSYRDKEGLPRYTSMDQAYADRHNWRWLWHEEIAEYNKDAPARLARGILEDNRCYVGMRSSIEYRACVKEGLFDYVIWVDASKRMPPEGPASMNIDLDKRNMFVVYNNGSKKELRKVAESFRELILEN